MAKSLVRGYALRGNAINTHTVCCVHSSHAREHIAYCVKELDELREIVPPQSIGNLQ